MAVLTRVGSAMKGSALAPLYPFARKTALAALRAKAAVESGVAYAVRAPLALLPLTVQSKLKHLFRPVAKLDYRRHRILLHADSAASLYRAGACAKEPETVAWIEEYVRPGDVLYDVGANVGAYSLVASKHCGGDVRVLAFEPSFATYAELCRNIVLNRCEASVIPHLICLTESPGLVVFRHSSLEPGSALHLAGDAGPGFEAVYNQEILGFSIDWLVGELGFPVPNHLKIDVDGTELSILRGAAKTLGSGGVRSIQVEVSPQDASASEVTAFLAAKGFRKQSETARGGGTRWSNYLFVRNGTDSRTQEL